VNVFIPAFLQQHILQFGAEGTQWLVHLPRRIAELEQEWGFRVGPAFDHGGAVSWVAPVAETQIGELVQLPVGIQPKKAGRRGTGQSAQSHRAGSHAGAERSADLMQ
jgi:hypothetical protein